MSSRTAMRQIPCTRLPPAMLSRAKRQIRLRYGPTLALVLVVTYWPVCHRGSNTRRLGTSWSTCGLTLFRPMYRPTSWGCNAFGMAGIFFSQNASVYHTYRCAKPDIQDPSGVAHCERPTETDDTPEVESPDTP